MLSRVADSLYWMSRYVERAENVARFIDVNYNLTLGEGDGLSGQWAPLVDTTGDHEDFKKLYGEASRDNVVQFLAFDERNPNSILSCVSRARESARSVRETITSDMWEALNKFYLMVRSAARSPNRLAGAYAFCDAVRVASHTLIGITYTTMSHGEAWHFLRMGRLIERADKTSRIVDVQYYLLLPSPDDVGSSLDVVRWSALLRSTSALSMYRRVHGQITPNRVADFLILDRDFPRAMRFCVLRAQNSLDEITGARSGTFRRRSEQLFGRMRAVLDYTAIEDVIARGMHEYIDEFQTRLNEIGAAIQADFFTQGDLEPLAQSQRQS
ncbi:MAG: alpha-E domain-containing protein [Planctomycetales bacterium]|nr:alpha-E domain-containing protein [Planctomycetales bacterium]